MIPRQAGRLLLRSLILFPLTALALGARVDTTSAQVPARVETPYTLMDAESRRIFEVGAETPLRGNGPLTGYGYFFYTRPHFLHEDLYLRLVIPPGYLISELILDHWPSQNSAVGVGVSGGLGYELGPLKAGVEGEAAMKVAEGVGWEFPDAASASRFLKAARYGRRNKAHARPKAITAPANDEIRTRKTRPLTTPLRDSVGVISRCIGEASVGGSRGP